MKHFIWDYTRAGPINRYSVWAITGHGAKLIPDSIDFDIPLSYENTTSITKIVVALDELAEGNK